MVIALASKKNPATKKSVGLPPPANEVFRAIAENPGLPIAAAGLLAAYGATRQGREALELVAAAARGGIGAVRSAAETQAARARELVAAGAAKVEVSQDIETPIAAPTFEAPVFQPSFTPSFLPSFTPSFTPSFAPVSAPVFEAAPAGATPAPAPAAPRPFTVDDVQAAEGDIKRLALQGANDRIPFSPGAIADELNAGRDGTNVAGAGFWLGARTSQVRSIIETWRSRAPARAPPYVAGFTPVPAPAPVVDEEQAGFGQWLTRVTPDTIADWIQIFTQGCVSFKKGVPIPRTRSCGVQVGRLLIRTPVVAAQLAWDAARETAEGGQGLILGAYEEALTVAGIERATARRAREALEREAFERTSLVDVIRERDWSTTRRFLVELGRRPLPVLG